MEYFELNTFQNNTKYSRDVNETNRQYISEYPKNNIKNL